MTTQSYRLYRDPSRGPIAGVCAGLADYFGLDARLVRIGWVVALLVFFLPAAFSYVALSLFLPVRPDRLFDSPDEERLRRSIHLGPREALRDVRLKFRDAEERLARMEAAILSEDFKLRRDFGKMR